MIINVSESFNLSELTREESVYLRYALEERIAVIEKTLADKLAINRNELDFLVKTKTQIETALNPVKVSLHWGPGVR